MTAAPNEAADPPGRAPRRGELLVAALASAALVLPFLDKAVHQDDWAYLRVASLLVEHGAAVFDQTTHYQGEVIPAGQGVLHGPVWLLCMAFAQAFGEHYLLVGHLLGALFLGLLGGSLASLAARLGARPIPTALTFCAAPAPWVLATSLMTDLPMLALFSVGAACAVEGHCRGRRSLLVVGGLCGALAALTRYHGLAFVPLAAVLPLCWPPLRARSFLPAAVALAVFGSFLVVTLTATGQWDLLRATEHLATIEIDHLACLMSTVCAFGGVGIGWLVAALAAPRASARALAGDRVALALGAAGAGVGVWLGLRAPDVVAAPVDGANVVLFWSAFGFGGAALGWLLVPWARLVAALVGGRLAAARVARGPAAWIALWSLGFAFAAWWTVPFGSTRYALPALPGMFLLAGVVAARRFPAYAAWVALGVSALAGLGATVADRNAAAVYPELARSVAARVAPGGDWSAGRTWIWGELGFRWYLEREAGLAVLPTASAAPVEGDRILKSRILCTAANDDGSAGLYRLHPDVRRRLEPGPLTVWDDDWPLRVHHSWAGAGFYGHDAGFLPWAFSTYQHDELQVWNVRDSNPFLEHLGQARLELAEYPPAAPGGKPVRGTAGVERFIVDEGVESKLAIAILFPGRVTFDDLPVPAGAAFAVDVGEHHRLTYEGIDGPGSLLRVRVDGAVAAEVAIDTRRGDAKTWRPLVVDLAPWAGRRVALTLEAVPLPLPDGRDPGTPVKTLVGFADPRIVER